MHLFAHIVAAIGLTFEGTQRDPSSFSYFTENISHSVHGINTSKIDPINNVIDLQNNGFLHEKSPNPFRKKQSMHEQLFQIKILVGCIVETFNNRNNTAIINEEIYKCGDTVLGLNILSISSDSITLSLRSNKLNIPVQDDPIIILLHKDDMK